MLELVYLYHESVRIFKTLHATSLKYIGLSTKTGKIANSPRHYQPHQFRPQLSTCHLSRPQSQQPLYLLKALTALLSPRPPYLSLNSLI